MKFACIRKDFDPAGGGAEQYAANFVREFLRRGHQLAIFAERFNANTTDNLDWVKIGKSRFPSLCRTYSFHKKVQSTLRPEDYDVIYALSRTYPSDVFRVTEQLHAEWLPLFYGPLARFNPRHQLLLKMEKNIFHPDNTRFVITNSELTKQQVIRHYAYPAERIRVIRNGLDHGRFHPPSDRYEKIALREKLRLPQDRFVLLFVAANFRIKGLEPALRVVANLKDAVRRQTLLVAVGGDRTQPFLRQAEKLGISGSLVFPGRTKAMRDYYVAADLLFYPSLYEPFGNVCLEAFACGLPVLTTRQNGSSEIISCGQNGYVVDSPERLEDMIFYLEEFAGLSQATRQGFATSAAKAAASYTWEKHAEELENVFLNLDHRIH